MSAPIKLSTGRTVLHRPFIARNGVAVPDLEEAYFVDGSDMTRAEWGEYCEIVRRRNAARLAKQRAARKIAAARADQQIATLLDVAELADDMGMDGVAERLREQASC